MRRLIMSLAVLAAACSTSSPAPPASLPGTPEFDIRATVLAAYNALSGPAGRRDWNHFKELFAPGAHITVDGGAPLTPDDYQQAMNDELQKNALFEHPVSTKIDVSGNIAQAWCRYESRRAALDETPFARGTSAFQLVRVGEQWRISSVLIQRE